MSKPVRYPRFHSGCLKYTCRLLSSWGDLLTKFWPLGCKQEWCGILGTVLKGRDIFFPQEAPRTQQAGNEHTQPVLRVAIHQGAVGSSPGFHILGKALTNYGLSRNITQCHVMEGGSRQQYMGLGRHNPNLYTHTAVFKI